MLMQAERGTAGTEPGATDRRCRRFGIPDQEVGQGLSGRPMALRLFASAFLADRGANLGADDLVGLALPAIASGAPYGDSFDSHLRLFLFRVGKNASMTSSLSQPYLAFLPKTHF